MSTCKKSLCLLIAALMALMSLSAAFTAAAVDAGATAAEPLTVQVEMSKSAYFVTAKAKATVRVQNVGSQTLKNVSVSAFSEKHLLAPGSESCLLIPELTAGQAEEYAFEMVLDRKHAGVSFIERILLFFAQLFRAYKPMQAFPTLDDSSVQEVTFRHGSARAVLKIDARYQVFDPENPDDPPRPQVTYLDRYMVDILESGTYTVQMETDDADTSVNFTMYVQGDNRALEIPLGDTLVQSLGLPMSLGNIGKVRVILKDLDTNPKGYIAFPTGYMELEDIEDAAEMLQEASGGDIRQQMQIDRLQYCGVSYGQGYVCETYLLPEENVQYNFYFSETTGYSGLVRWDVVDLNTNQVSDSINIRLFVGITDSKAFTVSGRKMAPSELEGLFGG